MHFPFISCQISICRVLKDERIVGESIVRNHQEYRLSIILAQRNIPVQDEVAPCEKKRRHDSSKQEHAYKLIPPRDSCDEATEDD